MLKEIYIIEDLQGNKLKDLLSFAESRSDKMSISRFYYQGKLTIEEFNQMQAEFKESLIECDRQNRIYYINNNNMVKDIFAQDMSMEKGEEADKLFFQMLEQESNDFYNQCKFEDFINGEQERFDDNSSDFITVKITRCTPVNIGPVCEMCYYILGETYRDITTNMKKLFEIPYHIKNSEFEDLIMYNGDRAVLAIHSHECTAYMKLEDDEYEALLKLGIPHDLFRDEEC